MPALETVFDRVGRMESGVKGGILLGTLAIIGAVYYFGPYRSVSNERSRLAGSLSAEKKRLADAQRAYARYLRLKKKVKLLRVVARRVARSLPDVGEIPLGAIHKKADEAGVQILSVERKEEEEHLGYAKIPILLKLQGQYHRVMEFFWKLGRMDRITKVSQVTMENPRIVEGQVILDVSCEVATYRYLAHRKRKQK